MGCAEGVLMVGQYYPPCPEPELTYAISEHADSCFLTVLIQDQVGGLQVLHENQWVDVHPELLSEHNPPVYRETALRDYLTHFYGKGLAGTSALSHFRI
ncbi:Deacetoxyvindoline 4-hydroxylase [Handroanthus impetiginosus]|uniref:Deacetoxyvindoline 4-hydroxylase n=1 Tax=Handroanthus impetiginosus TaxID=429701 RepID=A0A2G9G821_9LAMI|nr:Deacetoxyvindoline 4-hydroxylase [Handroanthus impetiginosus]